MHVAHSAFDETLINIDYPRVFGHPPKPKAAMAEEGMHLAAARIQGLARAAAVRRLMSSIWREADEFAMNVIRGEREARKNAEAERRAREKVNTGGRGGIERTQHFRTMGREGRGQEGGEGRGGARGGEIPGCFSPLEGPS